MYGKIHEKYIFDIYYIIMMEPNVDKNIKLTLGRVSNLFPLKYASTDILC